MILTKYKIVAEADPFPFESTWIIASNRDSAYQKVKYIASQCGINIGKIIELESVNFNVDSRAQ